jgi:hypothetical protein
MAITKDKTSLSRDIESYEDLHAILYDGVYKDSDEEVSSQDYQEAWSARDYVSEQIDEWKGDGQDPMGKDFEAFAKDLSEEEDGLPKEYISLLIRDIKENG